MADPPGSSPLRRMRPLLRRAVRGMTEKHTSESGLIVVGQFPLIVHVASRRATWTLGVKVGTRRHKRYVTWLFRESTREVIDWQEKRVVLGPYGRRLRPLGPKWVPLMPGEHVVVAHDRFARYERSFALVEGDKRVLFWDATSRGTDPIISLRKI